MGPVLSILTAHDQVTNVVSTTLDKLVSARENNDFSIDSRPFGFDIYKFGEGESCYSKEEIVEIESIFKVNFLHEIFVSAFCNGKEDHKTLALSCCEISKACDGILSFGGTIDHEVKGNKYRIGNNDLCDIEFMKNWVKHPAFFLIK